MPALCSQVKRMRYAAWLVRYKPIVNSLVEDAPYDGYMFETYGAELQVVQAARKKHVWTLIDTGRKHPTITSGFHFVNRLGYFLTEKPCNDEFLEVSA